MSPAHGAFIFLTGDHDSWIRLQAHVRVKVVILRTRPELRVQTRRAFLSEYRLAVAGLERTADVIAGWARALIPPLLFCSLLTRLGNLTNSVANRTGRVPPQPDVKVGPVCLRSGAT